MRDLRRRTPIANALLQQFLGAAAISVFALVSSSAIAEGARPAEGKPCYPTEKTLYEKDGSTPLQCVSAGGPAYAFKVYLGEQLVWEGILPSTKPTVSFELPASLGGGGKAAPLLTIGRDLEIDPMGAAVFMREDRIHAINTYKGDQGTVIHVPVMRSSGATVRVNDEIVVTPVFVNSVMSDDFAVYRFEVGPAS
ncbi:hypothetical protein [Pseudomonas sp. S1(2024)]|uniref:hypothetical protein n=1 Tax=Pseudomonas sp. S1(2024) TaxID=3390191 RepID=UPI00397D79FC